MDLPSFTRDQVEIVECRRSYDGYFKIDSYTFRHQLFAGGLSDHVNREVFERGHAVAVLPYDPVHDRVVLIEQFRCGAFAALDSPWFSDADSPWLIEAVAGIIDAGESPEDVAHRETIEETGTPITELESVCRYLVSPGGSTEAVFVFVGHIDSTKIDGLHGLSHEGEDIRPFSVSADDAFAAIASGRILNAMTIIALQWLQLNKTQLRTRWLKT